MIKLQSKKIYFFFFVSSLFFFRNAISQTNSYYYYQGQPKIINLSNNVLSVHFNNNSTIADRQAAILASNLDLLNTEQLLTNSDILLKSKLISQQVLVYPCGIPPIENKTINKANLHNLKIPPCDTCVPNCTPYYNTILVDNFFIGLSSLQYNTSVKSVSQAIINPTEPAKF